MQLSGVDTYAQEGCRHRPMLPEPASCMLEHVRQFAGETRHDEPVVGAVLLTSCTSRSSTDVTGPHADGPCRLGVDDRTETMPTYAKGRTMPDTESRTTAADLQIVLREHLEFDRA